MGPQYWGTRRIQTRAVLYYYVSANTYLKPLYIVNFEMLQCNFQVIVESDTLRIACNITTLCGASQ
jgi:hypothetical protein